jgi:hypothetical protein
MKSVQSGFFFLLFFGALWLILGALVSPVGWPLKLLATLFICALTVSLTHFALPSSAGQPTSHEQSQWVQIRGPFMIINVVQYLAIFLVVFFSIRRRRQDLIIVLSSAVVGIHFLFLAPLFGNRIYYLTAVAILAGDGLALTMPPIRRSVFASVATGAVLWVTLLL